MTSFLHLLLVLLQTINHVVIFLEIAVLYSSTRADSCMNFAIAFARYTMFAKDFFGILGLSKTPGFLQEVIQGESLID